MTEITHSVDDVYGINRDLPLNYVSREDVDDNFIVHLGQRRNVVVYGSSKQGKTSLRKHCLTDDDYVVVSCSNRWSSSELNTAFLKSAGYRAEQSTSRTVSGHAKVRIEVGGRIGVPIVAKAKATTEGEGGAELSHTTQSAPLEIDPTDVNDIISALQKVEFDKYIVLEDFHYLPEETQKNFAFDLKAYHENSQFCFVVIGVWREKNRLIGYNGDLTERVVSIDADEWSDADLRKVVDAGEKLLGVQFDQRFVANLVENSFASVHLVQEACRRVCRMFGVYSTQREPQIIGANVDAPSIIYEIVSDQSGRYMGFLQNVSEGFQVTDKQMPLWIIYAVLKSPLEELRRGLRLTTISRTIKARHPDGDKLNNGNITQILKTFASLQAQKNIRPIIADYDTQNRSLFVVDRGFEIWLGTQDRSELLKELDLPLN